MVIPSVMCNTLCNACSVYLAEHMFPLTFMLPLTCSVGRLQLVYWKGSVHYTSAVFGICIIIVCLSSVKFFDL